MHCQAQPLHLRRKLQVPGYLLGLRIVAAVAVAVAVLAAGCSSVARLARPSLARSRQQEDVTDLGPDLARVEVEE